MAGVTTASGISGSLDASDLVTKVLQSGIAQSNVQSILSSVPVPHLTGTIPISSAGSVSEDLEELETSDVQGGEFTNVLFDLKKDRVKLAVSDESRLKSRAGDPLTLQINGAGLQLATTLDKKAVKALETSPKTGAASKKWSTVTNSILYDLAVAKNAIKPYKADFIVMPTDVYTAYLQNDTLETLATGNPTVLEGAEARIPGVNLDIFVDDNCTAKTATVGASGFCAVHGKGPVQVRKWDNEDAGAMIYQMDVFRQVVAPIYKTAAGLNKAAYQITALIE